MAESGISRRPQLSEEVATYLRQRVMSGQVRPGEYLRLEHVAEELGISVTPVREALVALRGEGFVQLLEDVPSADWAVPTQIFEGDLLFIEWSADSEKTRVEDGIGWVVYNNPAHLNAMSLEMNRAVPRIVDALAEDPEVRVVVVTGAGDRSLVSGADISEFGERRTSVEARAEYDAARLQAHGLWATLQQD